jgi:hypothetical protein
MPVLNSGRIMARLEPALKSDHDEAGHVDPVSHGEVPVRLQRPDEQKQEGLKRRKCFIRIFFGINVK